MKCHLWAINGQTETLFGGRGWHAAPELLSAEPQTLAPQSGWSVWSSWHVPAVWLPAWPRERNGHALRVTVAFLMAAICSRNMLCSESLKWMARFSWHLLSLFPQLILRNQLFIYFSTILKELHLILEIFLNDRKGVTLCFTRNASFPCFSSASEQGLPAQGRRNGCLHG